MINERDTMSDVSENDPVNEVLELADQLHEAITEKIDTYSQGHRIPMTVVIGVLDMVKTSYLIQAVGVSEDDIIR